MSFLKKSGRMKTRGIHLLKSNAPVMEAYRMLRTNIEFSGSVQKIQTLMLTSSVSGEGKSTISCNLARVFAYAGKKVLLVDLDLRKPTLHHFFHYENKNGITDVILKHTTLEKAMKKTDTENLLLLNAGTLPSNPSEILASEKIQSILEDLRTQFDLIIIDTPPVAVMTDAAVVSRYMDAAILVVSVEQTDSVDLANALQNMQNVGANILGAVLNNVSTQTRGYRSYDYYYKDYQTK